MRGKYVTNKDFEEAIEIQKQIIHQIILKWPGNILGGIWVDTLLRYLLSVSLRLRRVLDIMVKTFGKEVYISRLSLDVSSAVTGIHLIKPGTFRQLIQRDGFGHIFWNKYGEKVFIIMQLTNKSLVTDFLKGVIID